MLDLPEFMLPQPGQSLLRQAGGAAAARLHLSKSDRTNSPPLKTNQTKQQRPAKPMNTRCKPEIQARLMAGRLSAATFLITPTKTTVDNNLISTPLPR